MIHVWDIMSTMGCSVPWGTQITKDFSPMVLNTLHDTHDIPHLHHDIPHGTEHPNGTQDIPHIYHDIHHGTEHPHGTQDIPHSTHDIPHGTEHPHGTGHTL